MRLPSVRFTVRRLMVAVAVFAVALGAVVAMARWVAWARLCEQKVASHYTQENHYDLMASSHGHFDPSNPISKQKAHMFVSDYGARADYHRRMRQKWEKAAGRPWEPVLSDPPAPGP